MIEKPSINSIIKLGDKIADLGIEEFELEDDVLGMIKVIRAVMVIYGLVIALFSLIGALAKKKGFSIFALIISIPFYILIVGWVAFILFIVASIAHIAMVSKEKKAATV